jgi:hypothetical protein
MWLQRRKNNTMTIFSWRRAIIGVFIIAMAPLNWIGHAWAETPEAQDRLVKSVEVGVTGWFTQGKTEWSHDASHLDPDLGNPSSKLKYEDVGTNVVELAGKVRFKNRFFLQGNFGFAEIGGGRLTDDDFLSAQGAANNGASMPGAQRFSRTFSDIGGDDMWYVNADIGFLAHEFRHNKGFLDLFVGFQYWREKQVANGLLQVECTTASSPNPSFGCSPPGTSSFKGQTVITNTVHWTSLKVLGSEIRYQLFPRVDIDAKVAFLVTWLNNQDVHHLRTDLAQNPSFKMTGVGIGTNADLNVRVMLVQRLYLSGGYRLWWTRVTDGDWKIYGADGSSAGANLNEFQTLRHGPTVGLTYVF